MSYKYNGLARSGDLSRLLRSRAAELAEVARDLAEARERAVTALASQVRAENAVAADRALVTERLRRPRRAANN